MNNKDLWEAVWQLRFRVARLEGAFVHYRSAGDREAEDVFKVEVLPINNAEMRKLAAGAYQRQCGLTDEMTHEVIRCSR